MAFGSGGESGGRKPAKRSPRATPKRHAPIGVLAPKPTGVFAQPKLTPQTPAPRSVRVAAQRRVQRAKDALPGPTLPVRRFPDLAHPSHAQAQAIVDAQRAALAHTPLAAKQDAAAGNADRYTREQIAIALRSLGKLQHDRLVHAGLNAARANPEKYAPLFRRVDSGGGGGLTAPTVQQTPQLTQVHGPAGSGLYRDVLAMIGADHILSGAAGAHAGIAAHERQAPHHGLAGGLISGVVNASPVTAAALGPIAAATAGVAKGVNAVGGALKHSLVTAGAFNDDHNIIVNAGKDALRFPYDAVNSGVEMTKAAGDVLGYVPGGKAARTAVGTALLGPAGTVAGLVAPDHGSTERAKRIVGALDDGVLGALAAGDIDLAMRRFRDHPLYGVMEFTGAYGAVGRSGGALVRGAGELSGEGSALRRIGSTKRAPRHASPHSDISELRSYDKNLLTALAQKALERRQRRIGQDPNIADPNTAERMIRRATHEDAAFYQDRARTGREEARQEGQAAVRGHRGPAGKVERVLQSVLGDVAQRKLGDVSTRVKLADALASERRRLVDVYTHEAASMPDLAARKANLAHQGELQAAEEIVRGKHGEEMAAALLDRAHRYSQATQQRTDRLVELHALDPEQAAAAALRPHGITQMSLKFDPKMARTDDVQAAIDQARLARRQAKVQVRVARDSLDSARSTLAAERKSRSKNVASRRAKIVPPGAATGATRAQRVTAFMKAVEGLPRDRALAMARQEAVDAQRVADAQAAVKSAKTAHKGAKASLAGIKAPKGRKFPTGLVDGAGARVTLGDIRGHHDVLHGDMPAFVSHNPDLTANRAHFRNWLPRNGPARARVDVHGRTGESVRLGIDPTSGEHLVNSLVNTQGAVSAIENHDRFISRYGSTDVNGQPFTPEKAIEEIKHRTEGLSTGKESIEWEAVAAAPRSLSAEHIDRIGTLQNPAHGAETPGFASDRLERITQNELAQMAAGHAPKRNVVLVPKAALDEFEKLQKPTGSEVAKAAQAFTTTFRNTVLPTSTKWLFGNTAEMALRLALHGAALPVDAVHGVRIARAIKSMGDAEYAELKSRALGGLHFGSIDRMAIHRNADMFEGRVLRPVAKTGALVRSTPGPKWVIDAYQVYAKGVKAFNSRLEQTGQYAVLGRFARQQAQELTDSWSKALLLQGKTFEAIVNGAHDDITRFSIAAARQIDDVLGKYTRFGPKMRKATQTWTPFLPWYLNAAKFVYWTLPVKHPLKGALLASTERLFDSDQHDRNESLFAGDAGGLGADPRRSDGGIVPLSRYTPFGAFAEMGRDADHVIDQGVLGPVLPQFSTAIMTAAFGLNFSGRSLRLSGGGKPSEGKKAWLAAYALFESAFPFTQIGRRLLEHGDTGYDDSTILHPKPKSGTSFGRSAPERIFVPWTPTYLSSPTGGGSDLKPTAAAPTSPDDAIRQALSQAQPTAPASSADDDAIRRALAGP
jgi:hypothetical protein